VGVAADATVEVARDPVTRTVDLELGGCRAIAYVPVHPVLVLLEQVLATEERTAFALEGVAV
jgi:hypothetical protein